MTGDTLKWDTRFMQLEILGESLGDVLRVTCINCGGNAWKEVFV